MLSIAICSFVWLVSGLKKMLCRTQTLIAAPLYLRCFLENILRFGRCFSIMTVFIRGPLQGGVRGCAPPGSQIQIRAPPGRTPWIWQPAAGENFLMLFGVIQGGAPLDLRSESGGPPGRTPWLRSQNKHWTLVYGF